MEVSMKPKKKVVPTGLSIQTKPISDKGLSKEEYLAKVDEIRKQRETQEALDKVAEQH